MLFSHGGLAEAFVRRYVPSEQHDNADAVISTINGFGLGEMWEDLSPIWYRPQYHAGRMYKSRELLQVVGHTPVEAIVKSPHILRRLFHVPRRHADRDTGVPDNRHRDVGLQWNPGIEKAWQKL